MSPRRDLIYQRIAIFPVLGCHMLKFAEDTLNSRCVVLLFGVLIQLAVVPGAIAQLCAPGIL